MISKILAVTMILAALALAGCQEVNVEADLGQSSGSSCYLGGTLGPRAPHNNASAVIMEEVLRISPEGDPITSVVFPDDRGGNFSLTTRDCERIRVELVSALMQRLQLEMDTATTAQLRSAIDTLREISEQDAESGRF